MYVSRDSITFTDEELTIIYSVLKDAYDECFDELPNADTDEEIDARHDFLHLCGGVLKKICDNGEFHAF